MIYRFTSYKTFNRWNNSSLKYFKDEIDEAICFAKVRGIPNPWFVHPTIKGKIVRDVILNPRQLDYRLKKFFGK